MVCSQLPKLLHSFCRRHYFSFEHTFIPEPHNLKSEHHEAEIAHCSNICTVVLKRNTLLESILSLVLIPVIKDKNYSLQAASVTSNNGSNAVFHCTICIMTNKAPNFTFSDCCKNIAHYLSFKPFCISIIIQSNSSHNCKICQKYMSFLQCDGYRQTQSLGREKLAHKIDPFPYKSESGIEFILLFIALFTTLILIVFLVFMHNWVLTCSPQCAVCGHKCPIDFHYNYTFSLLCHETITLCILNY